MKFLVGLFTLAVWQCVGAQTACPNTISVELPTNPPTSRTLTIAGPSKSIVHVVETNSRGDRGEAERDLKEFTKFLEERMESWSNSPQHYAAWKKLVDWSKCHAGSRSDDGQDIDTVTPAVPGCPKYLKKSNIQWRRVGNPQLNQWEVQNVSRKTVKFTFRESGVNSSPDTLPPGQSTQVSTQNSTVPPYIVRDFQEMMNFDRTQSQQKSLQCSLSIRPQ